LVSYLLNLYPATFIKYHFDITMKPISLNIYLHYNFCVTRGDFSPPPRYLVSRGLIWKWRQSVCERLRSFCERKTHNTRTPAECRAAMHLGPAESCITVGARRKWKWQKQWKKGSGGGSGGGVLFRWMEAPLFARLILSCSLLWAAEQATRSHTADTSGPLSKTSSSASPSVLPKELATLHSAAEFLAVRRVAISLLELETGGKLPLPERCLAIVSNRSLCVQQKSRDDLLSAAKKLFLLPDNSPQILMQQFCTFWCNTQILFNFFGTATGFGPC